MKPSEMIAIVFYSLIIFLGLWHAAFVREDLPCAPVFAFVGGLGIVAFGVVGIYMTMKGYPIG